MTKTTSYPDDLIHFLTDELVSARREIRIYSPTLTPIVLANPAVVEMLSTAVRASSACSAHIIIADAKAIAAGNHPLFKLSRKIPSLCAIREHRDKPERYQDNYVILDRSTYVTWSDDEISINKDEPASVKERIAHFDLLWQHSQQSAELRTLAI